MTPQIYNTLNVISETVETTIACIWDLEKHGDLFPKDDLHRLSDGFREMSCRTNSFIMERVLPIEKAATIELLSKRASAQLPPQIR